MHHLLQIYLPCNHAIKQTDSSFNWFACDWEPIFRMLQPIPSSMTSWSRVKANRKARRIIKILRASGSIC